MKHLLTLLCISSLLLVSCMKKESVGSTESSLKADSVKLKNIEGFKAVNDIFNTGKFDGLDTYIEANFTEHELREGAMPGLAGLKKQMTDFRAAFPDIKFTVNDVVAEGDKVWGLITITGTNTGPMMGMPPTGKAINMQGVDIVKITNGKCVEHWGFFDHAKMMEQLGLMPPHGAGGPPPDGNAMPKGKKS
jgi:steroid delta-isomerase-like uncharacterized protein